MLLSASRLGHVHVQVVRVKLEEWTALLGFDAKNRFHFILMSCHGSSVEGSCHRREKDEDEADAVSVLLPCPKQALLGGLIVSLPPGSTWVPEVPGHHLSEGCLRAPCNNALAVWSFPGEDTAEEIIELGGMSDYTCSRPEVSQVVWGIPQGIVGQPITHREVEELLRCLAAYRAREGFKKADACLRHVVDQNANSCIEIVHEACQLCQLRRLSVSSRYLVPWRPDVSMAAA